MRIYCLLNGDFSGAFLAILLLTPYARSSDFRHDSAVVTLEVWLTMEHVIQIPQIPEIFNFQHRFVV